MSKPVNAELAHAQLAHPERSCQVSLECEMAHAQTRQAQRHAAEANDRLDVLQKKIDAINRQRDRNERHHRETSLELEAAALDAQANALTISSALSAAEEKLFILAQAYRDLETQLSDSASQEVEMTRRCSAAECSAIAHEMENNELRQEVARSKAEYMQAQANCKEACERERVAIGQSQSLQHELAATEAALSSLREELKQSHMLLQERASALSLQGSRMLSCENALQALQKAHDLNVAELSSQKTIYNDAVSHLSAEVDSLKSRLEATESDLEHKKMQIKQTSAIGAHVQGIQHLLGELELLE